VRVGPVVTVTEPRDKAEPGDRPQPGARSRAALLETPAGWVLTLTVDARTAGQLREELASGRPAGWFVPQDFEVSITPNLVPGAPFPLCAVEIVVE
jgi:hypothetical protein